MGNNNDGRNFWLVFTVTGLTLFYAKYRQFAKKHLFNTKNPDEVNSIYHKEQKSLQFLEGLLQLQISE